MNTYIRVGIYSLMSLGTTLLMYATPRDSFFQLVGLYSLLFACYFLISIRTDALKVLNINLSVREIIIVGLLLRFIVLWAIPNLSDDYFRFVWDGRLLVNGENPFNKLPRDYLQSPQVMESLGLTRELFEGLNSPDYFTIYPPINQFVFWFGVVCFPDSIYGSVILMKFVLFLAEIGSMILIAILLRKFQLPESRLIWYSLNPMIIIELVGNLHFEALMIVCILGSIWQLSRLEWKLSAVFLGLGIASKLLPLMFLPLFIRRLGFFRTMWFSTIAIGITIILFVPLINLETILHLWSSIELYFQKFEFNASIYYLVRWVGYQIKGYNIIQTSGKWLALLTIIGILTLAFLEKKAVTSRLPVMMMWALSIYVALASIVHPWYISTLVALCTFSQFRYPVVWAALLPLTYSTYQTDPYQENLWYIFVIYFIVYAYLIVELYHHRKRIKSANSEPYI